METAGSPSERIPLKAQQELTRLRATSREYQATMRALRALVIRLGGEVTLTPEELLAADKLDIKAWLEYEGEGAPIHLKVGQDLFVG